MQLAANDLPLIYAVVVSYCPDPERLARQFESLLPQVQAIVWVDNGSPSQAELKILADHWPVERLQLQWLAENKGIGAAQNHGLAQALKQGATHILLMDDDSQPAHDMVSRLQAAFIRNPQAAAAGAAHIDARRAKQCRRFNRFEGGRMRWKECDPGEVSQDWQVDFLIASGCLLSAAALEKTGWMREDFFIDWVDTEWCLRAHDHGYRIYGVCDAQLEHSLGGSVEKIFSREIAVHPPWRHYYQMRNCILTLQSCRAKKTLKLNMLWRQLLRAVFFSILIPRRMTYLRMYMLGLWDGWRGQTGARVPPAGR